jgi:hypothetical protein
MIQGHAVADAPSAIVRCDPTASRPRKLIIRRR